MSSSTHHHQSVAAAEGNPTPQSTPVSGPPKGEFNILPIDEDKKHSPPPKGRHEGYSSGPDLRSEFHVGPALMPGAFISSMGTNATAFEQNAQKAKKD